MNNPAVPHDLDRGRPSRRLSTPGNNTRAKIRRNPLISLDLVEGIQGNPRESNSRNRGFSSRTHQAPRKPKRIDLDPFPTHLQSPLRGDLTDATCEIG